MHAVCEAVISKLAGRSMARALLPNSTVLCKGRRGCRVRARAFLVRHNQACAYSDGNTSAFNPLNRPVRRLNTPRSRAVQKCIAGVTDSHANTQTQASDPSGAQRSVTQEMFRRAERFASAAGPGIPKMHGQSHCIRIVCTPRCLRHASAYCSWGCWW